MYRPFLFVGLGGSGGKTLRFLKKGLQEWLVEHDWEDGKVPDAWQFLHIDTPTIPDGNELNAFVPMLSPGEYVGLVGDGVNYDAVASALDNIEGMSHEMLGWRIDPVSLNVPIGEGAGQFRAIGRTVAMLQGQTIRTRIKNSLDRIKTPQARADLGALYSRATGLSPSNAFPAPIVVVVSSLAGGTGAGLLMNVCDLIAELGDGSSSLALLYTPEVFNAVSGAGTGVHPNSLAAISEILNGHWLHGTQAGAGDGNNVVVPSRSGRDLQHAGAAQPLSRTGPAYPFLIGLSNSSGNSFGTDKALFEMIGSALVAWITDLMVQDNLVAYVKTNWENAAHANNPTPDILVNQGLSSEMGLPAFNALGVARLSLGLSYLERYAAERIAYDAATYIARAHAESDAALAVITQEGVRQPDILAARIADKQLYWFLKKSNLAEQGPDNNDVLNALRPDADSLKIEARNQAFRLAEVNSGGTASGAVWEQRITPAVRAAAQEYGERYLTALHDQVARWVREAPAVVMAAIEESIARDGIRVGAALARASAAQMLGSDGVVAELRGPTELHMYNDWSSEARWQEQISARTRSLGNKVDNRHPALTEAIDDALHLALYRGEAQLREQAAAVLESFAESYLRPLAAELDGESSALDLALQGDAANWAQWVPGDPPNHLLPPVSEITLIEPKAFYSIFEELLAETYPDKNDTERQLEVRREVTTGAFLRSDGKMAGPKALATPALVTTTDWWPGTTVVPTEIRTQSRAVFRVALSPEDLRDRSSAWMRRANSPFANMLRETLRSYLQKDATFTGSAQPANVYVERRRHFVPKLQAAISASAPLINLDTGLMGMLHPSMASRPSLPILSQLPFKNHELEADVMGVLQNLFGGNSQKAEQLLTTDALATSINVASTLVRPCSPLVIESLMRPIAEAWATNSLSSIHVKQFWLRRRSRRLEEFIPAPQEHIIAMCRGWFTGASLGIIDRSAPIRIGRPHDATAEFPRVFLSRSGDDRDGLALVLESLALAYVQVSQSGNLRSLDAYCALRDLGRYRRDDDRLLEYPSLGHVIEEWSRTGVAPGAIVESFYTADTELARLMALRDGLAASQSSYTQTYGVLLDQWRRYPSKLGEPPLWPGIRSQINTALDQLVSAIDARLETISGATRLGTVL